MLPSWHLSEHIYQISAFLFSFEALEEIVKVFLSPHIALHSPAMVRIANALTKYLPPHYQVVSQQEQADLCIFYPISYDWSELLAECQARGQEYVLVQCCFRSDREVENKIQFDLWKPWWQKALVVWSYLDLLEEHESWVDFVPFYHAPLGIDEAFTLPTVTHPKRDYIVTTGTVHGQGQEAILECWIAALKANLFVTHIGSWPVGIPNPVGYAEEVCFDHVTVVSGVTDQTLRGIYQNAKWVCSLRYVEGFELPALEALSCGTRSIVFTQPATTKWYWGYADFVPESSGQELIDQLVSKFSGPYEPISQSTIDEVRSKFNWAILCWRFWSIVEKEMEMRNKIK
jgi:glycosyltransferase involved in cell wall biosynthesis